MKRCQKSGVKVPAEARRHSKKQKHKPSRSPAALLKKRVVRHWGKSKIKAQPKPGGTLKKKSGQTLGQIKNKSPAEARRHS
jgi:hypothetical protein